MSTPRSIRFDPDVDKRLVSFVARHPGRSVSSAAARLVDEGLRMDEFPGVVFRDGPAGRRAALNSGPDIWEVVRSARSAREADHLVSEDAVVDVVVANSGVRAELVRTALAYATLYPTEIDAFVEHAALREQQLNSGEHAESAPGR